VTGSVVNFVLIASCLTAGTWSGIVVALLSPFFAKMFGIGPALIQIVPAIAVANAVYVLSYGILGKFDFKKFGYIKWLVSVLAGAFLKYIVLNLLVTKVVLAFSTVPSPMIAKLTAMFGVNQFITALIGGFLAMIIVPAVKKGIDRGNL
ncbi:MAG: ECF transporter S component, partial [Clostridia bacterium]|nr:ECF transporter S component [Clostridia bacterium]